VIRLGNVVGEDFGTNVVYIAPKSQFSYEALDHANTKASVLMAIFHMI